MLFKNKDFNANGWTGDKLGIADHVTAKDLPAPIVSKIRSGKLKVKNIGPVQNKKGYVPLKDRVFK